MSVIFYFMDGCPACEATWPTWRKVKKMATGRMREMESKQIPSNKAVMSFPTFIVEDANGMEVKRVEGSQSDPRVLMAELGLRGKKAKTRKMRRSRAGTTRRKIR